MQNKNFPLHFQREKISSGEECQSGRCTTRIFPPKPDDSYVIPCRPRPLSEFTLPTHVHTHAEGFTLASNNPQPQTKNHREQAAKEGSKQTTTACDLCPSSLAPSYGASPRESPRDRWWIRWTATASVIVQPVSLATSTLVLRLLILSPSTMLSVVVDRAIRPSRRLGRALASTTSPCRSRRRHRCRRTARPSNPTRIPLILRRRRQSCIVTPRSSRRRRMPRPAKSTIRRAFRSESGGNYRRSSCKGTHARHRTR
jgi:hypothetical protein